MIQPFFADTSGFYAISAKENVRHEMAIAWLTSASKLITTRFIVLETVSLITKRISSLDARVWYKKFIESRTVEVREFDFHVYAEAERLWKTHSDKTWDLIDCYSFCLMHLENLTEALTFDRHFQQAGFHIIE